MGITFRNQKSLPCYTRQEKGCSEARKEACNFEDVVICGSFLGKNTGRVGQEPRIDPASLKLNKALKSSASQFLLVE